MLRWRLISAAIILAVLLGLLFLDFHYAPVIQGQVASGLWLVPLILLMVALASAELVDLLAVDDFRPRSGLVYFGAVLVVLASCMPIAWPLMGRVYPPDCPLGTAGWPLGALFASLVAVVVTEMRAFRSPRQESGQTPRQESGQTPKKKLGQTLGRISVTLFCITYIGLLSSYIVQLRLFHDHAWGMAAMLSMLIIVKMSDVGAYTFGRLFGRHKLFPLLSPGKTVEGAVGGLLTAAAVSALFGYYLLPLIVDANANSIRLPAGPATIARWVAYGLLIAAFGVVGDITISLLKRDVRRKDSGSWLPGLGGALDVMDSIFMAAPPAFFCWVLGLIGPEAAK